MKDISKINEYFETDFYNLYGLKKGNKPKIFETKDCFKEEKYNFNLTYKLKNYSLFLLKYFIKSYSLN